MQDGEAAIAADDEHGETNPSTSVKKFNVERPDDTRRITTKLMAP
jgi:hypothetical protein